MYKTKLGKGKGNGIIPFPIGSIFPAMLVGYELSPVRDARDNKKVLQAIANANNGDADALDGIDEALYYERCVLSTPTGTLIRTIDEGYSTTPMALKVIRRDYTTTNARGEQEVREGKALTFATEADLANATNTINGQTTTWAVDAFAAVKQPN